MKEEWSLYTLFGETMLCFLPYEETADPKTLRKVNLLTPSPDIWGFPGGSDSEESACNAGDLGSVPGLKRSPGEGNGYPLQHSCLENSKDRGDWQATETMGPQRVRHKWVTLSPDMCCGKSAALGVICFDLVLFLGEPEYWLMWGSNKLKPLMQALL